jgi:hypothetical protein
MRNTDPNLRSSYRIAIAGGYDCVVKESRSKYRSVTYGQKFASLRI